MINLKFTKHYLNDVRDNGQSRKVDDFNAETFKFLVKEHIHKMNDDGKYLFIVPFENNIDKKCYIVIAKDTYKTNVSYTVITSLIQTNNWFSFYKMSLDKRFYSKLTYNELLNKFSKTKKDKLREVQEKFDVTRKINEINNSNKKVINRKSVKIVSKVTPEQKKIQKEQKLEKQQQILDMLGKI